jgi:hypothetical protein
MKKVVRLTESDLIRLVKRVIRENEEEWNSDKEGELYSLDAKTKEFHKDNTYVPDTTKPAKTMDIQWPRDQQAWPVPRTTNPWPPNVYQACGVCGIGGDINKGMSFVCNNPQCPTRVTCTSTTGTTT